MATKDVEILEERAEAEGLGGAIEAPGGEPAVAPSGPGADEADRAVYPGAERGGADAASPVSRLKGWWRRRREGVGATDWGSEWKPLAWIAGIFLVFYFLPVGNARFDGAVTEALALTKWYAQEHVLLCLIPAFFIAGAISVFLSEQAVLKYLGPEAPKPMAYGVASVSGTLLAVCSCTVLPLFGGIYANGAGLGPASAFLYSGPAINVLAIVLTANVLGLEIGVARAVGAVAFALILGLLMHLIFRRSEMERSAGWMAGPEADEDGRPLWQNAVFFGAMVGVLVFANIGAPDATEGFWYTVFALKWKLTAASGLVMAIALVRWIGMGALEVGAVTVATAALAVLFP
ncbi:MAG: permease, partial [Gemmatimonadota bacterium]